MIRCCLTKPADQFGVVDPVTATGLQNMAHVQHAADRDDWHDYVEGYFKTRHLASVMRASKR